MKMEDFISRNNDFKNLFVQEDASRSSKIRSGSFNPSQITQCKRRIAYRLFGEKKSNDSSYFKNSHRRAIVGKWAQYFRNCKKTQVIAENEIVGHADYNISGITDIVIEYDDVAYAVLVRPVQSEIFSKIKKSDGLRKDVVDLMLCMWMAEVHFGMLIYENNDTQEIEIFEVDQCDLVLNEIKRKCETLIPHQLRGVLPKRDYEKSDSKECKSCEYIDVCFK